MAQPTSPAASGRQPGPADLGVLFVHGIGDQQQYSTLAQFGGALQRWLNRWLDGGRPRQQREDRLASSSLVDVVSVQQHPGDRNDPAHARMTVTHNGTEQRWLLAEAWWAQEVTPPKFSAFVRWVLPMFPWLAAEYAVAASRRTDPADAPPSVNDRKPSWIERGTLSGVLWLVSPVIAVVLMLVCLLLALLQRLPVVGKWVSSRTVNLVKGMGDSYLFAHDALARAAMIQRIQHDLDWLRANRCRRIAIVAHSQGAALCHDLLRAKQPPDRPVELLVTVGSGVQRLNGFRELYQDAVLRSLGWASIAGLFTLVAGMLLVLSGLGRPGVPGFWATLGCVLVAAGALLPGMVRVSMGPDQFRFALTRLQGAGVAGLGAAALTVAGLAADGPTGVRLAVGGLLLAAGIALYGLAYRRVEREILERRPQLALRSQAAAQWVDYYSTADPVPNGPLRTRLADTDPNHVSDPNSVHPQARCVHNLRSVQADHSFYFDNADEFVSRLALDLTGLTGLDLGELPQPAVLMRTRAERRWRTACRSNLRNLLLAAGTFGAVAISLRLGGGRGWAGLGADLGVSTQAPYGGPLGQAARAVLDWLSKRPGLGALKGIDLQLFSGVLVAAAVVTVAAFAMGWLWSTWDQGAIERFFERHRTKPAPAVTQPPTWTGRRWHAVLGWVAAAWRRLPAVSFLVLAGVLTAGTAAAAQRYADAWWLWLAFAAAGAFTAALTLARWRTCLGRSAADPASQTGDQGTASAARVAAGSPAPSGQQSRSQHDRYRPGTTPETGETVAPNPEQVGTVGRKR